MIYVYAIRSLRKNYCYVGQTDDVIRRFHEHNAGSEKTTNPHRPFILIFSMECKDRIEARKYEKFYKTATGKRYLKNINFPD